MYVNICKCIHIGAYMLHINTHMFIHILYIDTIYIVMCALYALMCVVYVYRHMYMYTYICMYIIYYERSHLIINQGPSL